MLNKEQGSKKKLIGHQTRRVRVDHLPFLKKNTVKPNKSNRVIIKASPKMKIKAVFKTFAVCSAVGRT